MDLRPDNPCDRIGPVLRAEGDVVRHVRALRRGDVAQAINTVGGGGGPPVFTDGSGKPLHGQRLPRFLRHHAIAAVPHGFRSSFRDWAAEETDHPREVVEAALAHVVPEQGRGRLSAHGSVRALALTYGRLGSVSGGQALRTLGRCFKRRSGSSFEGVRWRGLVRLS